MTLAGQLLSLYPCHLQLSITRTFMTLTIISSMADRGPRERNVVKRGIQKEPKGIEEFMPPQQELDISVPVTLHRAVVARRMKRILRVRVPRESLPSQVGMLHWWISTLSANEYRRERNAIGDNDDPCCRNRTSY